MSRYEPFGNARAVRNDFAAASRHRLDPFDTQLLHSLTPRTVIRVFVACQQFKVSVASPNLPTNGADPDFGSKPKGKFAVLSAQLKVGNSKGRFHVVRRGVDS
jgi:hypothetical protein